MQLEAEKLSQRKFAPHGNVIEHFVANALVAALTWVAKSMKYYSNTIAMQHLFGQGRQRQIDFLSSFYESVV